MVRAGLAFLIGIAVGVGGMLLVDSIGGPPEPGGEGLAIQCTYDESACWRGGERVSPPQTGTSCEVDDERHLWVQQGAGLGPSEGWIYTCSGGT